MASGVFWTKIIFIVVCWCEAFFSGCFPTWSRGCRENPKVLGIANAFASGVFLAIALIHILPEEADLWVSLNPDKENLFPLPYFLMWAGYTLILFIDKVAFDTAELFQDDPAAQKLASNLKNSILEAEATGQDPTLAITKAIDEYQDPNAKFATRMSNALKESDVYDVDQDPMLKVRVNLTEVSESTETLRKTQPSEV